MPELEQMFQFFSIAGVAVAIILLVIFLVVFYNVVVKAYYNRVECLFDNSTEDMDYDRKERHRK